MLKCIKNNSNRRLRLCQFALANQSADCNFKLSTEQAVSYNKCFEVKSAIFRAKMDEIILFDKSLQQRFVEYDEIFSRNEPLTLSQIKKEWSNYLEFSIDPMGWQAVWKIPRFTCEDLNISFPTLVIVCVDEVKTEHHSAIIKILAVQDDISLPEFHEVPLMELYPTMEQDKSIALDIQTTANSIDMLRFFYMHIFLPWDYEEEESIDWIGSVYALFYGNNYVML